jgi:CubicO group peptidase (beta-lactamase class C family)
MATTASSTAPGFEKVEEVFRRQLEKAPGGGAVCVYHRGKPVVDCWGGVMDDAGSPWQQDTLAVSFSTTKGVTATLLHQLVEAGKLNYDDPVVRYWPEFGAHGKDKITVRDLLTHRAGLYSMRQLGLRFQDLTDWNKVTAALAEAPADLSHQPASVYHALTYGWLVGEVIQRVSGQSITDLTQQMLAGPLNLDGLYIGVPDSEHHRVAELLMGRHPDAPRPPDTAKRRLRRSLRRGVNKSWARLAEAGVLPDFSAFIDSVSVPDFHPRLLTTPAFLRAAMPAVNGVFTARSLARLYGALAHGGELDGSRILKEETIATMSERQVFHLDRSLYAPMRWRLGYHQPFVLRHRRPRKAFGHFGYGGSGAWADPGRDLAVAITVNAGTGTPWGDMRILKVGAAALRCAEKL